MIDKQVLRVKRIKTLNKQIRYVSTCTTLKAYKKVYSSQYTYF